MIEQAEFKYFLLKNTYVSKSEKNPFESLGREIASYLTGISSRMYKCILLPLISWRISHNPQ